jgi:predicted LPLAT superfamily acyltransferase
MPKWHGKSQGNPLLGYQIVYFVCSRFGVYPAYLLLRLVAFYFFLFSWNSSGHSYHYFRKRQHFGVLRSILKVYQNYYVFALTILDKVIVMGGIVNKFTYEFEGEENLRAIVQGGRGGILLSAHAGNWEAAGHLLSRLKTNIHVVMYDAEHEGIKAYLDRVTGGRKVHVIVVKEDMSHVYAIGEALRKNELICMHADRFLEGSKTVMMEFLGGQAQFPEGPFAMAAASNVPVSIVFAFKESRVHYHFYGSPPIQRAEMESKKAFVVRLMDQFIQQLEEKMLLYPEQWFNYYNFWE